MLKLIKRILAILSLLTAISLGIAYASVYIKPQHVWIPAFFGLAYPYILLLALILIVLGFILRTWRPPLVLILVLLLGWNHLNHFFRIPLNFNRSGEEVTNKEHLDLLTFNVRLFNIYQTGNITPDSLFSWIRSRDADVVCLQEIYTGSQGVQESELTSQLKYRYFRFNYMKSGAKPMKYGMALFSKYPIVASGKLIYPDTYNATMYCDIAVGSDTLRIFNNHLQSTRLNKAQLFALNGNGPGESFREILDIPVRLRDAFRKRASQADILKAETERSPYRFILCGDFNDTPVSYTYRKLSQGLNDSFMAGGKWLGKTYSGLLPSFRIDYILTGPGLIPKDYTRFPFKYSDHFPVRARIMIVSHEREGDPDQHSLRKE